MAANAPTDLTLERKSPICNSPEDAIITLTNKATFPIVAVDLDAVAYTERKGPGKDSISGSVSRPLFHKEVTVLSLKESIDISIWDLAKQTVALCINDAPEFPQLRITVRFRHGITHAAKMIRRTYRPVFLPSGDLELQEVINRFSESIPALMSEFASHIS